MPDKDIAEISGDAQAASPAVGERLPYNEYTTIDWMHELIKDSVRHRHLSSKSRVFESLQGWLAAALIGFFTAVVAYIVDITQASVFDWKDGYCSTSPLLDKGSCCKVFDELEGGCSDWREWTDGWGKGPLYLAVAASYGVLSAGLTMTTRHVLPRVDCDKSDTKIIGSGIPEIKTILSGFVIKGFLGFRVLFIKATGAVFAVGSGMCLGKEGPFVHISACVGNIVARLFPKYRDNARKQREIISASCAAGLSVAFGAPIGGVLFSFEEISTYFPRKVLWRSFFCSLIAAATLKQLNPLGTGKLILFETSYKTTYSPLDYLFFVFLGISGGAFGAAFCKANFLWSKKFRKIPVIRNHPVLEVFAVVALTGILQYPNPITRQGGDSLIKSMLVECTKDSKDWLCSVEKNDPRAARMWLIYGVFTKLFLTTITFGCKVPSGIIIPALDAGALFGRLVGLSVIGASPGIFAMVGAAAALAGVTRMTLSLCVIMFELTGELEFVLPHMIAILVAKWTADSLEKEGIYDLAQMILGHPFLDAEAAISAARKEDALVRKLIPPKQTMEEITVHLGSDGCVSRDLLEGKLALLRRRGLMDAGLVLVEDRMLRGYISEGELEFGLGKELGCNSVRLICDGEDVTQEDTLDLSMFVDQTPMVLSELAPMEYAVELFGKLGLRYVCVTRERTGELIGVVIKKRLVGYLESIRSSTN
ncbi:uncharacterized protein H6S33_004098 [Morchella sextelata]|uniref:uncharacterized protein n=1 Tax=Morchella sextelata TaxID=1174677 RepID=UPI001D05B741|nr:uncharacterized protein H6S33_004098 [Morchella sextelata]KAH0606437.1 hypothetical protein H6S33_004098 [Morchella sextelata]